MVAIVACNSYGEHKQNGYQPRSHAQLDNGHFRRTGTIHHGCHQGTGKSQPQNGRQQSSGADRFQST
jgi:hypothetical protein